MTFSPPVNNTVLFVSSACSYRLLRACHSILANLCNGSVIFISPMRKPSLRVLHVVNVELGLSFPKSSFFSLLSYFPRLCGPSLYLGPEPFVRQFLPLLIHHPGECMFACIRSHSHTVSCSSGVSSRTPVQPIRALCRIASWELWRTLSRVEQLTGILRASTLSNQYNFLSFS